MTAYNSNIDSDMDEKDDNTDITNVSPAQEQAANSATSDSQLSSNHSLSGFLSKIGDAWENMNMQDPTESSAISNLSQDPNATQDTANAVSNIGQGLYNKAGDNLQNYKDLVDKSMAGDKNAQLDLIQNHIYMGMAGIAPEGGGSSPVSMLTDVAEEAANPVYQKIKNSLGGNTSPEATNAILNKTYQNAAQGGGATMNDVRLATNANSRLMDQQAKNAQQLAARRAMLQKLQNGQ